jgi:nicotinate dehydrogenase subunit A
VSEGYDLIVNGEPVHVDGDGTRPLLAVLRDELALRGSRFGCGTEECGACMVLIDGEPSFSCTRAIESLAGKAVTTVEGLSSDGALSPLQQAFLDEQAGQCGYCLSGILISATALLAHNSRPSRSEIAAALDRHLCRCGVHNRIMRAVARAALASEASGQRGNSIVRAHSASEDARERADDTRPEPGSSARAAAATGAQP